MKCFEIQNEIPEYLEDMLAESVRSKIHAHLLGCDACRSHAARLGSLAGDLRELAHVALPFDLEKAVMAELERQPAAASGSFSGKKMAALFLILCCAAGIAKLVHSNSGQFKKMAVEEKPKIADEQAEAILERLKQTEASLSRGTGEAGSKAANKQVVASLEPFHWHLKFPNNSERQFFSEKIKRLNPQMDFGTEYLMIFSINQSVLEALGSTIDQSSATVAEGPKGDLKKLPQSIAPLRVTILMDAEGTRNVPFWWELRFLRQNSYLLARRLHESGFKFIYESPNFVLLSVSSAEYRKLRAEMQEILGLQIVRGEGDESRAVSGSFPVILFLQEG